MSQGNAGQQSLQIKICGITNMADALDAIDCGADALGFNLFRGSRRFIEIDQASEWVSTLPASIRKVAVMVNPSFDEAVRIAALPFIDELQLHGTESPRLCSQLAEGRVTFTKAIPIRDETSLTQSIQFSTDRILLDSMVSGVFGGTGQPLPWSIARQFVDGHPELQVILAGGLNSGNVRAAIAQVRPAGVDVTSGVEAEAGRKNRGRVQAFISAAREA
jgi:phosphoribosylanthranilate isomerase